jgi:hypothetical protein
MIHSILDFIIVNQQAIKGALYPSGQLILRSPYRTDGKRISNDDA